MRVLIIFLLSLLIASSINAQKIIAEYEITPNEEKVIYELLHEQGQSVFYDKVQKQKGDDIFYKDFIKQAITFKSILFNNTFNVIDSLNIFNWVISNDTMTILGKKCFSAKCNFRGRKYIAYFCPEIPINDGPWKLNGLPGLILYAKTEDDFIEWKCVKLTTNSTDSFTQSIAYSQNSNHDWTSYIIEYKKTIEKFIKHAKSSGNLIEGTSAKIKIESIELFYPELQTGEGIKF